MVDPRRGPRPAQRPHQGHLQGHDARPRSRSPAAPATCPTTPATASPTSCSSATTPTACARRGDRAGAGRADLPPQGRERQRLSPPPATTSSSSSPTKAARRRCGTRWSTAWPWTQLRDPERLAELAEHQQDRVKELYRRSEQEVAARHPAVLPARLLSVRATASRAPASISTTAPSTCRAPPTSPARARRRWSGCCATSTSCAWRTTRPTRPPTSATARRSKKGQITTADLRAEFRRDPSLPMLIGDDIFVKAIRQGIEPGEYVYQSGDLLYGKGDPAGAASASTSSRSSSPPPTPRRRASGRGRRRRRSRDRRTFRASSPSGR